MSSIDFQASIVFQDVWNALNLKDDNGDHVYKLILEEGSSRSTKTWSNFQVLFLYLYENPISSATVLRDTQKSCREIVEKDWKDWLKDPMVRKKQFEEGKITLQQFDKYIKEENLAQYFVENKTNHTWAFKHNGNFLRFTGLDDEDDAMGMTQTLCWINEPYSFSHEVYRQLAQRSKVILFDWNPKQNHWIEKEKLKESTYINYSTFLDNPFLSTESRNQLLSYQPIKYSEVVKEKLITEANAKDYDFELNQLEFNQKQIKELKRCIYNEKVKSASEYHWLVYGLGLKSEKPNKIYNGWKAITLEQYNAIDEREYFGLDYGWAKPTALVGIKYDGDRTFYVRPALYKPMNEMKGATGLPIPLGEFLIAAGFPPGNVTYGWADSSDKEAGSEISTTNDLRTQYNLNIIPTSKPTYKARWEFITNMQVCYVEDENFEFEYDNYELEYINDTPTGKPVKKDDHCFVGATLVRTNNGAVRIDEIKVNDLVQTSNGYRRVLKTWDNGIKNTIEYVLYLDDKVVNLICTPNHKIKTNKGWIEISKLKEGMTVFLNNSTKENPLSYNQEKYTLIMGRSGCIDLFGKKKTTKLFQRVMKFITKMKTPTIIGPKTWNLLKVRNTEDIMEKRKWKTKSFSNDSMMQVRKNAKRGIQVKPELNGIENTPKDQVSENKRMEKENVKFAGPSLKQKTLLQSSAQENAFHKIEGVPELIMRSENAKNVQKSLPQINIVEAKIVALVAQNPKQNKVYDLTIEDNHEYFANGILVHNCMNAFEYGAWGVKTYLDIKI